MNILITGSEGVIGRRLVRWLKEHWPAAGSSGGDRRNWREREKPLLVASVFTCDRLPASDRLPADQPLHTIADITHPETLRRAFTASQPELVFHLAASVGRLASEAWASVALRTNVEGTQNVVNLCQEHGARLLYVSTSEVYGDAFDDLTGDGEKLVVHEEVEPLGFHQGIYGLSKYLGEQVVELAVKRHGLDAVIARPFMCYSEDEPLSPYRSAIAQFMRAIVRGEPIEVHEGAVRSWCYVDDMASGLARLGLSDCQGVYNVGRHDPMTLKDVAQMLRMIMHKGHAEPTFVMVVPMPDGIYGVKHASFDKIRRDIGWEAETTLEEGLRLLVAKHFRVDETVEAR